MKKFITPMMLLFAGTMLANCSRPAAYEYPQTVIPEAEDFRIQGPSVQEAVFETAAPLLDDQFISANGEVCQLQLGEDEMVSVCQNEDTEVIVSDIISGTIE